MRYSLLDHNRRHFIGDFSKEQLFSHLFDNTGFTDIYEAVKVMDVQIVQTSNLLDLEKDYTRKAESLTEAK